VHLAPLPWFASRRRNPVTCTGCGARLERILPAASYYTLAFVNAIVSQVALIPLVVLAFMGRWGWIVFGIATLVSINILVSDFLNSRTRVEFVDPADAREDKPGRWYPS
jgi:hypothetical protein